LLAAGTATADDVRDAVELPPGVDPRCLGAVPGELADAGIIRATGYVRTTRPAAHARPEFADAGVAVVVVSAVGRTKDGKGRSTYAGEGLNLAS
ncbi:hypothetical protein NP569_24435, partial [Vibrio parahaemolyticus]|nr:hypothetical protein [Vibrio parahaemolyticus]